MKEKSKEKQMPKKDSMKKTPENNKKDMPDTQSKSTTGGRQHPSGRTEMRKNLK